MLFVLLATVGCGGRVDAPSMPDGSTSDASPPPDASNDSGLACKPGVVASGDAGYRCGLACTLELVGRDESFCTHECANDTGCGPGMICVLIIPARDPINGCVVPCEGTSCSVGTCTPDGIYCRPQP